MTVVAKTLAAAHYDAPPRAYFNSCSTGGRQARLKQRYPGIRRHRRRRSPWDQMRLYAARVWLNTYVNRTPQR
jgi:hypothetical protein